MEFDTQELSIEINDSDIIQEYLEQVEDVLKEELIDSGVKNAMIIDKAGNVVAKNDNGNCDYDVYALAVLASANFAVVDTMAKIIGEKGFSLFFHKGKNESIHFSKINDEYLLVTRFGKDLHQGLLHLKIEKSIQRIKIFWNL